jgi:hypothetical protein
MLGCMSISCGGHHDSCNGDVLSQEGKLSLRAGGETDVYYPQPYASPPNLSAEETFTNYEIVEQKADHFRIRNTSPFDINVTWTARGVKHAAPPVVVVSPASSPAAPTQSPLGPPEPAAAPVQLAAPETSR